MSKVYYFGCLQEAGHHMHDANLRTDWGFLNSNPWGRTVDSDLCPKGNQAEGKAALHYKGGWTALAFWDRSVDSRPGSNSVFLAEGAFDFGQMLELARATFPSIMQRFTFSIEKSGELER